MTLSAINIVHDQAAVFVASSSRAVFPGAWQNDSLYAPPDSMPLAHVIHVMAAADLRLGWFDRRMERYSISPHSEDNAASTAAPYLFMFMFICIVGCRVLVPVTDQHVSLASITSRTCVLIGTSTVACDLHCVEQRV